MFPFSYSTKDRYRPESHWEVDTEVIAEEFMEKLDGAERLADGGITFENVGLQRLISGGSMRIYMKEGQVCIESTVKFETFGVIYFFAWLGPVVLGIQTQDLLFVLGGIVLVNAVALLNYGLVVMSFNSMVYQTMKYYFLVLEQHFGGD